MFSGGIERDRNMKGVNQYDFKQFLESFLFCGLMINI